MPLITSEFREKRPFSRGRKLNHVLCVCRETACFVSRGERFFVSPKRPDRLWGSVSFLFNGTGGFFLGVKRPGRELTSRVPTV
jgi:hypothetical protein